MAAEVVELVEILAGDEGELATGMGELDGAAMHALKSDREEALKLIDLAAEEALAVAVVGGGGGDAAGFVHEDERAESVE